MSLESQAAATKFRVVADFPSSAPEGAQTIDAGLAVLDVISAAAATLERASRGERLAPHSPAARGPNTPFG